jgi:hypothetical protein
MPWTRCTQISLSMDSVTEVTRKNLQLRPIIFRSRPKLGASAKEASASFNWSLHGAVRLWKTIPQLSHRTKTRKEPMVEDCLRESTERRGMSFGHLFLGRTFVLNQAVRRAHPPTTQSQSGTRPPANGSECDAA